MTLQALKINAQNIWEIALKNNYILLVRRINPFLYEVYLYKHYFAKRRHLTRINFLGEYYSFTEVTQVCKNFFDGDEICLAE